MNRKVLRAGGQHLPVDVFHRRAAVAKKLFVERFQGIGRALFVAHVAHVAHMSYMSYMRSAQKTENIAR